MIKFNEYSKKFINLYTNEIPEMLLRLLAHNKVNFSILDLGCGDGDLLLSLYNRGYLQQAKRIVGVDLSLERIKRLKSKKITNLELICSDACNVRDLADSSFDYIFNTQVIEHVPDDKALLVEIHRLLKRRGILYISSVVKKRYGWYIHRCNNKWSLDPTHLREYSSEQEFTFLIENAGFEIDKVKMTLYKFIPLDFLIRRIYFPLFKPKDVNSFFLRHKILRRLRIIKIPIPGYYIIEVVAIKK